VIRFLQSMPFFHEAAPVRREGWDISAYCATTAKSVQWSEVVTMRLVPRGIYELDLWMGER
jgi:hypothetical protein